MCVCGMLACACVDTCLCEQEREKSETDAPFTVKTADTYKRRAVGERVL